MDISELIVLAHAPYPLSGDRVDAVKRSRQYYAERMEILGIRREELVKKLEEDLSDIDRELSHISDCLKACNQALSPISHVPSDILREIFLHLHLCFPRYHTDSDFSPLRPPMVLSQVCRRWRAEVYDFAYLWSKARTTATQRWNHAGLKFLSQCFRRAKGMPLELQLVSTGRRLEEDSSDKSDELTVPVFVTRLMEPIGGSLTHLLLKDVNYEDLLPLCLLQLPSLEQLGIVIMAIPQAADNRTVSFVNTPALRRVSYSGSLHGEPDHRIVFPWDQLTHFLCYDGPQYFNFFLINYLPLCTQLRLLHFDSDPCERGQSYLAYREERIVLPILETLSLDFPDSDPFQYGASIFFPFEFPNLRSLLLGFNSIGDRIPHSTFLGELRRLKSVEHLSIMMDGLTPGHHRIPDLGVPLVQIFRALPSIKTLKLSFSSGYSDVLNHLDLSSQHDLLPNLRTLALTLYNPNHRFGFVTHDSLFQFVDSRPQLERIIVIDTSKGRSLIRHPKFALIRETLESFSSRGLVYELRRNKAIPFEETWMCLHPDIITRPELLELY